MDFAGTERFAILSRLGQGGLGVVYEAFDRERKSRVALKTLRRVAADTVARLKHEFRSLQDLRHPNLVTLYELFEERGDWFFTMELVSGSDFMQHVGRAGDAIDARRLRETLRQLAQGLNALHQGGKVHRDIKPGNVLVTRAGRAVLLDFGLVADTRQRPDEDDGLSGTVEYMAPEQARGEPAGAAADWYGVGAMLYQALSGAPPFTGRAVQVLLAKQQREAPPLAAEVPADLGRLCLELLRIDPAARPTGPQILERLGTAVSSVELAPEAAVGFVGRSGELARLHNALDLARRGRPATQVCLGVAGVGKSALVEELIRSLEPGVVVCRGRCYQHETVPFKGIDGIVEGLCDATRASGALLPPDDARLIGHVFPTVRTLAPRTAAPAASTPMDPRRLREQAALALRSWLDRLARHSPTLVVIEDLHWGGADTWELLHRLLAPPDPPPLLTLATARLEPGDNVTAIALRLPGEVQPLLLEPLGPEESLRLARSLLGSEDRDLPERVARRAAGHPLDLLNMAHHALTFGDPESRGDALVARLSRLEGHASRFLEILAVADEPLPLPALQQALDLSAEALEQTVTALQLARLVRPAREGHPDQVEPYHDLVRQAARESIDADRRRELHRLLALALDGREGIDPGLLALQWHGAREHRLAADYALQAALEADGALAFDRAARLYDVALRAMPAQEEDWRRTQIRRGHALANAGRGHEAADAFLAATADETGPEALELRRHAAEQLLCSGQVDRGLALLEETLASVGIRMPRKPISAMAAAALRWAQLGLRGYERPTRASRDPTLLPRTDACWSATVGLGMVDVIRAMYFQALHTSFALRSGDPQRILRALAMETPFHAARGRRGERRTAQLVELVRELAALVDRPHGHGLAAACIGFAALQQGRWRDASDQLGQAVEIFRGSTLGNAWELNTAQISQLWAQAMLGELRDLARRVPLLLHDARARGNLYASAGVAVGLTSWAWLAVDDPRAALEAANVGMNRWARGSTHIQHVFYTLAVVNIDLYSGNAEAAYRRVADFWPRLARSRVMFNQLIRVVMLDLRARAALAAAATGRLPRAPLLGRARADAARLERQGRAWSDGLAALIRAGLTQVGGDPGVARRHLARAVEHLERAEMALHLAAARQRLGEIVGGAEGEELIRGAAAYMDRQGVRAPERLLRMLLPRA